MNAGCGESWTSFDRNALQHLQTSFAFVYRENGTTARESELELLFLYRAMPKSLVLVLRGEPDSFKSMG